MHRLKAAGIGIFLFTFMAAVVTFALDCNYILAGISSEELFHSEMHKLPNFKQTNTNGIIVYNYTHGQINQSFQLIFKEGILIDGFFFSLNNVPPSNEFKKVTKPLFAAVGFNPDNTSKLKLFCNQINKRRKQNDNFKVGNYIITVQTQPCKDGIAYNLKFQRI